MMAKRIHPEGLGIHGVTTKQNKTKEALSTLDSTTPLSLFSQPPVGHEGRNLPGCCFNEDAPEA